MIPFARRWSLALGGLALLTLAAPVGAQQFNVVPATNYGAYRSGAYTSSVPYTYRPGFQTVPHTNPYYSGGYYGNNYFQDPMSGYLQGAASVFQAQGQFLQDRQQAEVVRQQAEQAKIDTRRKTVDEWLYEQQVLPKLEDLREQERTQELRRAMNNPPTTEIWSGKSLNDILSVLKQVPPSAQLPDVPLSPDILPRINVTSGSHVGSLGPLREDGKLQWPLPLKKTPFEADRKKLEQLTPIALQQAASGSGVDDATLEGMIAAIQDMQKKLDDGVDSMSWNDSIKASRYVNELDGAVKTLQDPNVSKYATKKWAAKGNTVGQLVMEMSTNGLKFAPATAGDEAAYNALYTAMANYNMMLGQVMNRQ